MLTADRLKFLELAGETFDYKLATAGIQCPKQKIQKNTNDSIIHAYINMEAMKTCSRNPSWWKFFQRFYRYQTLSSVENIERLKIWYVDIDRILESEKISTITDECIYSSNDLFGALQRLDRHRSHYKKHDDNDPSPAESLIKTCQTYLNKSIQSFINEIINNAFNEHKWTHETEKNEFNDLFVKTCVEVDQSSQSIDLFVRLLRIIESHATTTQMDRESIRDVIDQWSQSNPIAFENDYNTIKFKLSYIRSMLNYFKKFAHDFAQSVNKTYGGQDLQEMYECINADIEERFNSWPIDSSIEYGRDLPACESGRELILVSGKYLEENDHVDLVKALITMMSSNLSNRFSIMATDFRISCAKSFENLYVSFHESITKDLHILLSNSRQIPLSTQLSNIFSGKNTNKQSDLLKQALNDTALKEQAAKYNRLIYWLDQIELDKFGTQQYLIHSFKSIDNLTDSYKFTLQVISMLRERLREALFKRFDSEPSDKLYELVRVEILDKLTSQSIILDEFISCFDTLEIRDEEKLRNEFILLHTKLVDRDDNASKHACLMTIKQVTVDLVVEYIDDFCGFATMLRGHSMRLSRY